MRLLKQYFSDECGATAIEYGLICTIIAVAVGVIAFLIGDEIDSVFNFILLQFQG